MTIEHFGGTLNCKTIEELSAVLDLRYGEKRVNEFWLRKENDFPDLALMVKGEYACVVYFPAEGHPGFHSVGKIPELDPNNSTVFKINAGENMEVCNYQVIQFSQAKEAAIEFFKTQTMTDKIEWEEL